MKNKPNNRDLDIRHCWRGQSSFRASMCTALGIKTKKKVKSDALTLKYSELTALCQEIGVEVFYVLTLEGGGGRRHNGLKKDAINFFTKNKTKFKFQNVIFFEQIELFQLNVSFEILVASSFIRYPTLVTKIGPKFVTSVSWQNAMILKHKNLGFQRMALSLLRQSSRIADVKLKNS